MSGNQHPAEATRRRLTERQADTVRRRTDAAVEVVRRLRVLPPVPTDEPSAKVRIIAVPPS